MSEESNDIIDMHEYFMGLWAHKVLIVIMIICGILIASFYALNTTKIYTSQATFKFDRNEQQSHLLSSNQRSLSFLANSFGNSEYDIPVDEIKGRVFIQEINGKLDLINDPYFNNYNPNSIEPFWLTSIRNLLKIKKPIINIEEVLWQNIATKFRSSLDIIKTTNGSIRIISSHTDNQRAAYIANSVMEKIIQNYVIERESNQSKRLNYLSKTLAESLSDLEFAQESLKTFALENAALPLESFATRSMQLDTLRDQLKRTSQIHDALFYLLNLLQNNSLSESDYVTLRDKYPIVDQVEFRRVLGQNEIISSWNWPDKNSVMSVYDTLSDRKKRLQTQIDALQIEANKSGNELEKYSKLQRNEKIAEATYKVLIEQVKSLSMSSGFMPENTEIYEYAAAAAYPTSPNKKLALIIGAVLGFFVGCLISSFFAQIRGVHYTQKSLISSIKLSHSYKSKPLMKTRKLKLKDLILFLEKNTPPFLRNIAIAINNSKKTQIIVTSTNAKIKSTDFAKAAACYMQSNEIKIALINFSTRNSGEIEKTRITKHGNFIIKTKEKNISELIPKHNNDILDFLSQKNFTSHVNLLQKEFDYIIICADDNDAISLLQAINKENSFHVMLVRKKYSKKSNIKKMNSFLGVEGLLHD